MKTSEWLILAAVAGYVLFSSNATAAVVKQPLENLDSNLTSIPLMPGMNRTNNQTWQGPGWYQMAIRNSVSQGKFLFQWVFDRWMKDGYTVVGFAPASADPQF